ncbi:uncharacterized protein LOC144705921 isoform X2 [Wolffia australiana]
MPENVAESIARYAPPFQRNRSLGRRKSGDRLERLNYASGHDAENIQYQSRNFPTGQKEKPSMAIPIDGCAGSNAARWLRERWANALQSCNDPAADRQDKPVLYGGAGGPAWGQFNLPHQVDFLAELRRAYHGSLSSGSENFG